MSSVAQILEAFGRSQADLARQRGEMWGGAIQSIGQLPGQIQHQRQQQQRLNAITALEQARELRARGEEDRAIKLEAFAEQDRQAKADIFRAGLQPDGSFSEQKAMQAAVRSNHAHLAPLIHEYAEKLKPAQVKTREVTVTNPDGTTTTKIVKDEPGQEFTGAARPATYGQPFDAVVGGKHVMLRTRSDGQSVDMRGTPITADVGAYERPAAPEPLVPIIGPDGKPVLARRSQAEGKTPAQGQSGMGALYGDVDPKAIASAIRAGTHPPDISQYGRPASAAIASELAKPGPNGEASFNLSSAQREWKAQLNLNRTMNGAQQVRLDESIRSGLAMYDRIDALAEQWDGKGWGPLSRANLAAAREGAKGPEAASLANQLTGQIGQLTSDVATIEQGGLTPTSEARHIAELSLQDWWGKGTVKAMTAQGRANMQIRHMARQTQEPLTPGNNPSTAPAQPAAPAPVSAAPKLGEVVTVKGVRVRVTKVNPDGSYEGVGVK